MVLELAISNLQEGLSAIGTLLGSAAFLGGELRQRRAVQGLVETLNRHSLSSQTDFLLQHVRIPECLHGTPHAHDAIRGARPACVQGAGVWRRRASSCGLGAQHAGAAGGRLRRCH